MNRVLRAGRMHLVHPLVILGIPWLVVGISFAINVAVWHLTPAGEDDGGFSGGILALYITVLVVYVQAVTQLLPFSMGISLSRRTFYLGTALVAAAQALLYGLSIAVLVAIENATDGWGAGLSFWAPGVFEVDDVFLQILASGAPMLAFMSVGIGIGIVHQRWGQTGTWGLMIGTLVFFGGLAILISLLEAWRTVGDWFADQSTLALTAGLPLAIAAVVALISYPGIRRVVP
ncbi:hypothetical protein JKP75_18545 [Blastococcus sp. TML/M2B]|uniref:hypothetical protein n=1 Tax=unclassified Blastococcus TaxID=2619396 RepID=UPI00190A3FA2|nr:MULTISPECIES: hypothetical protein [unclassified Blastococcus]MBN1091121.1 hypothetical protein [Blastococcus sp. TML/M2B]MBN1094367.1 hypothetical protein [Blastococcus sp. TML/M2B]MBN1095327.1 hypothetical protein [Blastococcus sp. TML/C7B]